MLWAIVADGVANKRAQTAAMTVAITKAVFFITHLLVPKDKAKLS
jgi:hypothetical protein